MGAAHRHPVPPHHLGVGREQPVEVVERHPPVVLEAPELRQSQVIDELVAGVGGQAREQRGARQAEHDREVPASEPFGAPNLAYRHGLCAEFPERLPPTHHEEPQDRKVPGKGERHPDGFEVETGGQHQGPSQHHRRPAHAPGREGSPAHRVVGHKPSGESQPQGEDGCGREGGDQGPAQEAERRDQRPDQRPAQEQAGHQGSRNREGGHRCGDRRERRAPGGHRASLRCSAFSRIS